jgi:hypothetical protein
MYVTFQINLLLKLDKVWINKSVLHDETFVRLLSINNIPNPVSPKLSHLGQTQGDEEMGRHLDADIYKCFHDLVYYCMFRDMKQ